MTTMASQITSLTVVYSTVYSDADKENVKAPRHWPLCWEFTGTGEFPAQRASYTENVSTWWRHHDQQENFGMHFSSWIIFNMAVTKKARKSKIGIDGELLWL